MSTATTVKERPIRLNAHEITPVLAGRKTVLRRPVHPQPFVDIDGYWKKPAHRGAKWLLSEIISYDRDGSETGRREECVEPPDLIHKLWNHPAKPGERMWVKEKWAACCSYDSYNGSLNSCVHNVAYADGGGFEFEYGERGKWRSSTHMPRWASRITLEITRVHAERLHAIRHIDAVCEGIEKINGRWTFNGGMHESRSPVEAFAALWDSIHGDGSWDENPWVWVVEFKRI